MVRGRRGTIARDALLVAALAAACLGLSTQLDSPPRFDGAGYAVLARSIATGQGYREIDHPDRPRHAHFPPGYPIALSALWRLTGPSARAAHLFSCGCTVGTAVLTFLWFRRLYPRRVALTLGLALAVNWTWTRAGGSIQSEPLFLLLGSSSLLVAAWAARGGGMGRGLALGLWLGAAVTTRHVGACLAAAVGLDLLWRGRRAAALGAVLGAAVVLLPWVAWLASVRDHTQVGLLPGRGLTRVAAGNALFYVRRLPDALTGPLVEVATVFRPGWRWPATAWAAAATAVVFLGWVVAAKHPRRRLAALVPWLTFGLLLAWPFTEAGRFLIPLVPFVLVGAVEGLATLAGVRSARSWAAGLVLAASVPYAAYALVSGRSAASERTHADFDAACSWIVRHGDRPGPILTRQAGEAYWLTGRQAMTPPDDATSMDRLMERDRVAYLMVEDRRYALAPDSPLGRYVATRPGRVEKVWEGGAVVIYRPTSAAPRR